MRVLCRTGDRVDRSASLGPTRPHACRSVASSRARLRFVAHRVRRGKAAPCCSTPFARVEREPKCPTSSLDASSEWQRPTTVLESVAVAGVGSRRARPYPAPSTTPTSTSSRASPSRPRIGAHAEAILSGLPTIGTTVGSQAEIIGDAGRVVPPDDSEALAAAILDVAEHYEDVVAATLARRDADAGPVVVADHRRPASSPASA